MGGGGGWGSGCQGGDVGGRMGVRIRPHGGRVVNNNGTDTWKMVRNLNNTDTDFCLNILSRIVCSF